MSRLIVRWDDALADEIGADNLFLDRRGTVAAPKSTACVESAGACSAGTGFDTVENALRGSWTMSCERETSGRDHVGPNDAPASAIPVGQTCTRDTAPRAESCQ